MKEPSDFTIEKGVLLPEPARKRVYPFAEMEVGDSFAVPFTDRTDRNIRFAASAWGNQNGRRFTVRRMKAEGCTRVWRIQ